MTIEVAPVAPAVEVPAAPAPVMLDGEPTAPVAITPVAADPVAVEAFTYDSTGDAGLDYALNFIGKLGYGDGHPAVTAAQSGDFSLIKAELATKGVPGVDAVMALAEQAYTRFAADDAKKAGELSTFAAQAAGGADNWAVVRAWAAAEATPQEKAQVNAALAQGGLVAQGVIGQLVSMYRQKHTLDKDPATVAKAVGGADPTSSPLTARAYAAAVDELRRTVGNGADSTPEYAALQARRLAARKAGY